MILQFNLDDFTAELKGVVSNETIISLSNFVEKVHDLLYWHIIKTERYMFEFKLTILNLMHETFCKAIHLGIGLLRRAKLLEHWAFKCKINIAHYY